MARLAAVAGLARYESLQRWSAGPVLARSGVTVEVEKQEGGTIALDLTSDGLAGGGPAIGDWLSIADDGTQRVWTEAEFLDNHQLRNEGT